MFRKMRRFKQELSKEECMEILKNEPRGVLSVLGDDGYPYGMPVTHWYNEKNGKIYFHGAKSGHKIDAIKNCDKVSFCVYDKGYRKENDCLPALRKADTPPGKRPTGYETGAQTAYADFGRR